jgi:hypothetical protein
MDTKRLRMDLKDANEDKGEVTAVFATFNKVDSDGDVTLPGAFDEGAPVLISAFGHQSWGGALPVGKGTITSTKTEAVFNGQFFMDTTHGLDTFRTVKQTGELQEWSYGYDPVEYSFGEHDGQHVRFLTKQQAFEVSPVLRGAGVGTRTLSAKSAGLKFSDEATAVMATVKALADRAADVMAKRQEKGKALGADSAALLEQVTTELKRFEDLLREPEPDTDQTVEVQHELLRFLALNR